MKRNLILCLTFVLLGSARMSWGQDLEKGLEAYESRDYETALQELKPLAEQGVAEAQIVLMDVYLFLDNLTEHLKWAKLAAEQGQLRAIWSVGNSYEYEVGTKRDIREAMKWYRRAYDHGYGSAADSIGWLYYRGDGVIQDFKTATEWFRRRVEEVPGEFSTGSMWALGMMYRDGKGEQQDNVRAHMWFNIAKSYGDFIAADDLKEIAENMTGAEINRAQDLVRECVAKDYKGC